MLRIETEESQRVKDQLKEWINSKEFESNREKHPDLMCFTDYSNTTRSIYITIDVWDNVSDPFKIRISDHIRGFKSTLSNEIFSFENFDLKKVKRIYRNLIKNLS